MEFVLNEYHRNTPDADFIQDLQRVAKIIGDKNLTTEEYSQYGKFHSSTICRRFGGWVNALKKAGIDISKKQLIAISYTRDEIIKDIKSFYDKYNKVDNKIYDRESKIGLKRVLNEFRYWELALKEAGIPLNGGSKHITNEDLLCEIERVWIKLGRQPTTNDIKNGVSKFSLNTFARRFGSWRNALETFVQYVNENNIETSSVDSNNEPNDKEIKTESVVENRKTQRDINLRLRFLVMKRDNFKCCMCGRSPATTPNLELHIDHIKPWSKGGETVIENLQTLCSDCNLGKSNFE